MHDHLNTGRDPETADHWDIYAEAMDLTIEGHRLIAQEIAYEARMAWQGAVSWLRGVTGSMIGRRSSPSA